MRKIISFLCLSLFMPVVFASIQIATAENFYGDVAQSIGSANVSVYSVMSNPNQDPHMFSASPKVAMLIHDANIIVENGVGYDAWMDNLYASSSKKASMINVGNLMGKVPGANPHIWYDPNTMPV